MTGGQWRRSWIIIQGSKDRILTGTVVFVKLSERQKPTILTFKYRRKPIKTTKKLKGFDRFLAK